MPAARIRSSAHADGGVSEELPAPGAVVYPDVVGCRVGDRGRMALLEREPRPGARETRTCTPGALKLLAESDMEKHASRLLDDLGVRAR